MFNKKKGQGVETGNQFYFEVCEIQWIFNCDQHDFVVNSTNR